jgi:hypothetical protein
VATFLPGVTGWHCKLRPNAEGDAGIANYNIKTKGWNLIGPGGWGGAGFLTVSDSIPGTTVLGSCLGGTVLFPPYQQLILPTAVG